MIPQMDRDKHELALEYRPLLRPAFYAAIPRAAQLRIKERCEDLYGWQARVTVVTGADQLEVEIDDLRQSIIRAERVTRSITLSVSHWRGCSETRSVTVTDRLNCSMTTASRCLLDRDDCTASRIDSVSSGGGGVISVTNGDNNRYLATRVSSISSGKRPAGSNRARGNIR